MRPISILLIRAVIDLFRSRKSLEAERLALCQELAKPENARTQTPTASSLRSSLLGGMTKVIRRLRKEGLEITAEMLGGIAPYRRGHLDLLGEYHLKFKKQRSRQAHQLF